MKFLLFYVGFIWLVAGVISFMGPLFGLDRKEERRKLRAEWQPFGLRQLPRKMVIAVAFLGFMFPIVYPFRAVALAVIALGILSKI